MAKLKKPRSCKLDLIITQDGESTKYHVKPIPSDLHVRAYQLRKDDGTCYHVTQELSGLRMCDCGAKTFNDKACKHIRVMALQGLLLSTREIQALRWHQERYKVPTPSSIRSRRDGGQVDGV